MSEVQKWYATGKRKNAIARVWIQPGAGTVTVNDRSWDDYFGGLQQLRLIISEPLEITSQQGKIDVRVNVRGGGLSGQADAIRHGLARALQRMDTQLRPVLKKAGLLTRDSRIVERKKYGRPGARKRFQYSKR
ncbi:MAG: 30S ribosomal protein S9 [Myxococcales bacterium]|nr:30S ribosomal protein S9 [Myxococcales bacterium]